jgi:hypothetical protein
MGPAQDDTASLMPALLKGAGYRAVRRRDIAGPTHDSLRARVGARDQPMSPQGDVAARA